MREIRTSGLTRGRGFLPPYSTVSAVIINYSINQYPAPDTKQHLTGGFDRYGQIKVVFSKKKAEWRLKKQATLEILNECPSYNEERLPEIYKRMEFPVSKS